METPELDRLADTLDSDDPRQFALLTEIWAVQRAIEECERVYDGSTVIATDRRALDSFVRNASVHHVWDGHGAELFACADPFCAVANAIDCVDTWGTYRPGNYDVTITVRLGEDRPE